MDALNRLGLSNYEARAYLSLLNSGPTTAKQLSGRSNVPMGRVYDVLETLEEYAIVSHRNTRPKEYVATQIETAAQRLLAERRRELRHQRHQYEQTAADLPKLLGGDQQQSAECWTAAVGVRDCEQLLHKRIDGATQSIDILAGGLTAGTDSESAFQRTGPHMRDALDRGVSIRVIHDSGFHETALTPQSETLMADLHNCPNYACRETATATETSYILDHTELCLTVSTPTTEAHPHPLAVVTMQQSALSADFSDAFEATWAEADATSSPTGTGEATRTP